MPTGWNQRSSWPGIDSETVLFEEFIGGRELTAGILGEEALPIVEIRPKSGIYDYANKYTAGRTEYFCPAELPRSLTEEVQELARRAHAALGCSGYSRVDFRLDNDGQPGGWFLSTSIGNKMSGVLASLWDGYENKANFFYVNCVIVIITTVIIFMMVKWLNAIVKEHNA